MPTALSDCGVVASVITPFRDDERIDFTAWQRILEMLISTGIDGILALGDEGEFRALSEEERVVALRFCRQTIAGRVRLYGNVGSASTAESIRIAQAAEGEGVDCAVLILPRLRLSPDEVVDYLGDLGVVVRMPIFGAGPVDSSPGGRVWQVCPGYRGRLESSAAANVAPRLEVELRKARAEARLEDASRLHALIEPLGRVFGQHTYPSVIKEAMRRIGLPAGLCRRPVGQVPAEVCRTLDSVLQSLREMNWLPNITSAARAGSEP